MVRMIVSGKVVTLTRLLHVLDLFGIQYSISRIGIVEVAFQNGRIKSIIATPTEHSLFAR